jgi:hypothetical protein
LNKKRLKKKKSKTKSTTRKQPARRTTRNKEESSDADNSSQPSENPTKRRKTQKDLKDFIVCWFCIIYNKKPAQNKNNQNLTPSIPSNISQHPPPQININSINPQFIQEIPKEIPGAPMYPYYHVTRWF